MATFNPINDFLQHIAHGVVNLSSDQLVVALSNTAPASETNNPTLDGNGILANVTQISYANLSSRQITAASSGQSGGTYTLTLQDLTLTASGGAVGPFRYVYIYDDTPVSPTDPLIGYYDYGSAITLNDGDSFVIDFDPGVSNRLLTLTWV